MFIQEHVQEIRTLSQHWRYVYSRRRGWHGVSTAQIVAGQLFTVVVSVLAGLLFDLNKETIAFLVGALVMMPGIIDLSASLTGAMCAKINHQIDTTRVPAWIITANSVIFALLVSILAGVIVGFVGGLLAFWLFDAHMGTMIVLSVVSLCLIGLVSFPLMALFTLLIRRFNMNPDNVSGPVESSVVDVIAIIIIAQVAGWLS